MSGSPLYPYWCFSYSQHATVLVSNHQKVQSTNWTYKKHNPNNHPVKILQREQTKSHALTKVKSLQNLIKFQITEELKPYLIWWNFIVMS